MIERVNLMKTRRAFFSECERYRYSLKIYWSLSQITDSLITTGSILRASSQFVQLYETYLMWICLNPSTADEMKDDNTLRRVQDYAFRWGYPGVMMCNLFGWRSTDPRGLLLAEDPVGPEHTIDFLLNMAAGAGKVIAAWGKWGNNPILARRAREVTLAIPMFCLRKNGDGSPEHPLYLPKTLEPMPFNF